jgi:hypothetical protein
VSKKIIATIINLIILCICFCNVSIAESKLVEPTEDQFFELRAVKVTNIEGKDKQVIFELWAHEIEFKGFDVRFSYDGTHFAPSNITTNDYTDDETEFFKFESEFSDCLELFTVPYTGTSTGGMRAVASFNPPISESEHIKNKENVGMIVDSSGSVLLGTLSFRTTLDKFDISSFKLETSDTTSPKTGIKIIIDGSTYYENQSTFRFTDKSASRNADLSNIKLSNGNEDDENYKEYVLNPSFDKNTLEYTTELLEYVDKVNLEVTKDDEKSSIVIKQPKHDENGNLVFEDDGSTIVYEEASLDDLKNEIVLNKLGEPDTVIELKVTAEDEVTTKTYKITIHRPYGTIKGSIHTVNSNDVHIADVKVYNNSDQIDWENISSHDELDNYKTVLNKKTNEDGTYEIKVIPGNYDVLIDKVAYLDYIVTTIQVNENDEIDLDNVELIPR